MLPGPLAVAGAGSSSILIGATAQHIAAERRSLAGGAINAGGSLGQFIFAPLNRAMLSAFGWMQAMWTIAVVALSTAPMACWLRGTPRPQATGGATAAALALRAQLKIAARDHSYGCLHAGFFACGIYIAF
jgi:predicted MFS family arabinose efflux permease